MTVSRPAWKRTEFRHRGGRGRAATVVLACNVGAIALSTMKSPMAHRTTVVLPMCAPWNARLGDPNLLQFPFQNPVTLPLLTT
jgi:hypothetical protein